MAENRHDGCSEFEQMFVLSPALDEALLTIQGINIWDPCIFGHAISHLRHDPPPFPPKALTLQHQRPPTRAARIQAHSHGLPLADSTH